MVNLESGQSAIPEEFNLKLTKVHVYIINLMLIFDTNLIVLVVAYWHVDAIFLAK